MTKSGRRGGPPDLKGTLGALLRTTMNQVGAVTDVARRSAQTQKHRLDGALLERRRREVLADLGEALHHLVRSGEIELEDLPELTRIVARVEEVERQIADAEASGVGASGRRRPVRLARADGRGGRAGARAAAGTAGDGRVWRPPQDADLEAAALPDDDAPTAEQERPASVRPGEVAFVEDDAAATDRDPDDSLEAYMHEDDVPRRK